ncbi:MAG TPA: hypothetical protein VKY19_05100 [Ktedonosporobacter sp.]|nr:hypothetical protein [Ktedonosporobacter sp.]
MLEELLAESWVFREWREKALVEGREEGLKQGMQEAMEQEMQRHRWMLLSLIQARFPALAQLAEERGKILNDPEQFKSLLLNVSLAANEQEAKEHLSKMNP